jgi:hypothetical protein
MRRLWADTDDRCDVIPQKCGPRPLAVTPWGLSDANDQGNATSATGARSRRLTALLPAGAGRRARAGGNWLAHALLIFVPAMFSGSLVGSGVKPTEVVAAVRNISVEVVLPEGGRCLQLSCTRGSVVLSVDRVGSPPDFDFTDEGDARLTTRRSPDRWRAVLVGVSSDMSGEVGDQPGALGKILAPNGMIMKRLGYAGKPRQRSRAGRCGSPGRRQSSTAAMSPAVCNSRPAAAVCRWRSGCSPVSAANPRRCALRVGHDGSLVSSGTTWSAWLLSISTSWEPTSCSTRHGARRCTAGQRRTAGQLGC